MKTDSFFSAFSRVQFNSVFDLQQVWMDRPASHLPLHQGSLQRFKDALQRTVDLKDGINPLGLCFVGPAGSGKTHLLGEIRREAAQQGANFVLSDLTDVRDFWPLLAMHYLQSLQKPMNGVRQLQRILEVLLTKANVALDIATLLNAHRSLPREALVAFANDLVPSLRPIYGQEFIRRLRVFRALLYLESDDLDLSERAYSFLQGIEQIDEESKKLYLFGANSARKVATDLAWFLSLCGPTVLAFDQLDPFVAQNNLAAFEETSSVKLREALQVLFDFVNGIMATREEFAKTLVVVSCMEATWKVLQQRAVGSFTHRFEEVELLDLIRDPGTPTDLVVRRLDEGYRLSNFTPPYRTWPFASGFFASLPTGLTPREILNGCEKHRLSCVRAGKAIEIDSYPDRDKETGTDVDFSQLNKRFANKLALIDPFSSLAGDNEDQLGSMLAEAARLFCSELPFDPNIDLAVEDSFQETKQYKSLHLRMRRTFHMEGDREEHVCIRVLQKANPKSFQVRLSAALTTSGMSENLDGRSLFLLRNSEVPRGAVTAEIVNRAKASGAKFLPFTPEDVRIIAAVVSLSKSGDPLFETWLMHHRPLSKTALFRAVVPTWQATAPETAPVAIETPTPRQAAVQTPTAPSAIEQHLANSPHDVTNSLPPIGDKVLLGSRLEGGSTGDSVSMPLLDLTRHVILRAGSGGGKTVFIKRLIEQSALCGIPSIVIDTAKDLSMLGDRWQQAPANWTETDAQLADQYHHDVDVQIWTPGHTGGRPMRLAPLPNLSGPFGQAHDREQVIEIAVAGLLPLAVQRRGSNVERAILKKVVEWLTKQPQHSGNELERLIGALRDLPAEAFQGYRNERKLAASMADQIQATLVADPLFGGQGEALDPAILFGVGSLRPRVSILSLFAMTDIDTQARFIGQLASALFNWIRRNPAPVGSSVRGLLVLDEAARFLPRNNAESKPALMLLAQQARKYGLGLILATQNPKDLDYNATANFATQIFGTANVPQVVKFIQEAMEQRGLRGLNPGQLKAGQFFCATPSLERPVRLQGPMCLSAHPHNTQLSDEDILERARRPAESTCTCDKCNAWRENQSRGARAFTQAS